MSSAIARLLDQARALTLEHLASEAPQSQSTLPPGDETFLAEVERAASRLSRSNIYAKHWFTEILSAESDLHAWAVFRLLLRCVDKRFWLWRRILKEKSEQSALADV